MKQGNNYNIMDLVNKHEEMIKELTLEISEVRQEIQAIQQELITSENYYQELMDSLADSIEGNYFNV